MRFLAKAELFKVPVLAPLIRALGAYSLDRSGGDVATIKKSIAIAKSGEIVVAFPQGHRYGGQDPRTTEIKAGIGMITYRTKAPVVPVFLLCVLSGTSADSRTSETAVNTGYCAEM